MEEISSPASWQCACSLAIMTPLLDWKFIQHLASAELILVSFLAIDASYARFKPSAIDASNKSTHPLTAQPPYSPLIHTALFPFPTSL